MSNGILNDEEKLTGFRGLLGNLVFPGLSGQPTNKQLIDAAILRGSLELLKPRQPNENFASQASRALTAATKFSSPTTGYRTGQEALAAGEAALGKDAKISVFQRSDGTFGYQGTTADTSLTDNSFFGEQPEGNNVTKEQYDKAVATIKAQAPDATEQDIKDTLEANNIRYTGE